MLPSTIAKGQYSTTTDKLNARVAIHAFNTNPESWFSWLQSHIHVSGDVLEVGAGTGKLWTHIDHKNARLTLTDNAPAMCDALRGLEIPESTTVECNVERLPFDDQSFDFAIANHMLYHVDDPDTALKELSRVLRPGGKLYASIGGKEGMASIRKLAADIGRPAETIANARIYKENAADVLKRYFGVVTEEVYPSDLEVPHPGPVVAYVESLGNEPITDAQRVALTTAIESVITKDGHFSVKKQLSLFIAQRS